MLEYVSTDGCPKGDGRFYLYASQLKALFAQMFERRPERPVVALLNYCRSGGALHFMKSQAARGAYGADRCSLIVCQLSGLCYARLCRWPLFLMTSSQPHHDALVGGLWVAFFEQLIQVMMAKQHESVTVSAKPQST